jgi:hypothetical protein
MDHILPLSLSDRVYYRVSRMEVAMRRFSQRFLQWFFMFGLLGLVLTCFVLAGCTTMAAGRAADDRWQGDDLIRTRVALRESRY